MVKILPCCKKGVPRSVSTCQSLISDNFLLYVNRRQESVILKRITKKLVEAPPNAIILGMIPEIHVVNFTTSPRPCKVAKSPKGKIVKNNYHPVAWPATALPWATNYPGNRQIVGGHYGNEVQAIVRSRLSITSFHEKHGFSFSNFWRVKSMLVQEC